DCFSEGSRPQRLSSHSDAAHEPAREREQHQEIDDAELYRDRGVLGDVLEDVTLCRRRGKAGDRELFEQERATEHEVDAGGRMRASGALARFSTSCVATCDPSFSSACRTSASGVAASRSTTKS